MSNQVESLTWLTDLHLEFCSHRTRDRFYHSINQAPGEIVIITGDLSAGPHRLAQYTELAEQIRKPAYFVLGNHDRYGTTFANAEAVVERVTTLFSHMVRLDGSQVIPLNKSVALVGVDGWADGLGGEGPATKARINDFYQILDFATEPEPQVFRQMKERARKYSQALKPSLIKALKQYQTALIATGSGANFIKCMYLSGERLCIQAARTAVQIPGAVVACPVSGLRLNCCFLIFSASSMPRIVTAAVSNRLNPSIGLTRCFIRR